MSETCKVRRENSSNPIPHKIVDGQCVLCGVPGNFSYSAFSAIPPVPEVRWCMYCHGRGETCASHTYTDSNGNIRCERLPWAGEMVLDENKFFPPWSIVICGFCHGTGMVSLDSKG